MEISGKVIKGRQYGRVLGFPTANLDRREYVRDRLKIRLGIWAGWAYVSSRASASEPRDPLRQGKGFLHSPSDALRLGRNDKMRKAAIVIGPIDKTGRPKIEAHLLNFTGNLYGKKITIELKKYIRPFKEYRNVEILKRQIAKDISRIKKLKF